MRISLHAAAVALLTVAIAAAAVAADDFGTPEEARAMLERTIAAMKADRDGTLATINAGSDPSFKDRDLYPFCGDATGLFVAHGANPALVGQSLRELKDKAGTALGEAMYDQAQPETVVEVGYMWPRPGEDEPTDKVSLVTRVGDDVCAVGYYR
jgi:signal transduction histidine kinase